MNKFNFQKNINKTIKIGSSNRGFTIVETLVAIFILLLSITGPLAIAQSGLRAAFLSRDQVTAFYLAQDAMESIKNVRDDNLIAGIWNASDRGTWTKGLANCFSGSGCTVDTLSDVLITAKCNTEAVGCSLTNPLRFNLETKEFGISETNTEKSKFSRVVFINTTNRDNEIEVTVKVSWVTHNQLGEREIEVREYMSNWLGV